MIVLTASYSWYLECAFCDGYFEIAIQKSEVQEVKTGIFIRLVRYIIIGNEINEVGGIVVLTSCGGYTYSKERKLGLALVFRQLAVSA